MNIFEYLEHDNIFTDFDVKNKTEFFQKAVDLIAQKYPCFDRNELLELYGKREKTMTTGIGKQIAIPHIIYEKCDAQMILIFRLKEPIDFASLDKKQVKLVLMLIGPVTANNFPYLQVLAKLSRMLKRDETVLKLLEAETRDGIIKVLNDYEHR